MKGEALCDHTGQSELTNSSFQISWPGTGDDSNISLSDIDKNSIIEQLNSRTSLPKISTLFIPHLQSGVSTNQ